jgi:2-phospho-L-lactate/phosphoenolpyruvate guanylyltransferase
MIIVLARDPRTAKTRLRRALGPAGRKRLAAAMLDDVVAAAVATGWPVLVVTDARSIAARARVAGASGMVVTARGTRDGARRGLTRAERDGAGAALIVAADVPFVRPADLRRIAAAGRRSEVVIVPDRRGSGTNALFLRPPSRIAPRFGRRSLAAHQAAAGVDGRVVAIARLGLDVDTPADLQALRRAKRRAGPRTRAALGRDG